MMRFQSVAGMQPWIKIGKVTWKLRLLSHSHRIRRLIVSLYFRELPPRDVLMVEVELSLHHSRESFDDPQVLVSVAKCQFSGTTPNVQQVPGHKLDIVGEGMVQE